MRILQVNKYLYRRGGAESYMLDVSEMLANCGHEVALFGMKHGANPPLPYEHYFPTEIEFEPAPSGLVGKARATGRMLWSSSAQRGIRAVIEDFRPDIVHYHNIYHQLSPSVIHAASAAEVPAVLTLHDYKLACPTYQMLDKGQVCDACIPRHFSQPIRRGCRNGSKTQSGLMALEAAVHAWTGAYGGVSRFLCPSQFMADTMRRALVFPDRLQVLPNFCSVADIATKSQAGGPVVFAGRLSFEKGVDTLIDAVTSLPDAHCVIAGEGPDRDRLVDLAGPAGSRVEFVGRLDRAGVLALLKSGCCAAVPSRWNENQPMVVLEAFACGVPVVCTTLGGLPDLVRQDETGLLVPPDDPAALSAALARLLGDPTAAHAMGLRARRYVEKNHNPPEHLRALIGVYESVAA